MPQLAVHGPLDECHLHDNFRTHPMRAQPRQTYCLRKRRRRYLDRIEPPSQIEQKLSVEAGSDPSREYKIAAFVITDEQCAKTYSRALRIGKATNNQLLRCFAFHFEPVLRAAMFVGGAAALRDDTFPPFAAGALPRVDIVQ